MSKKIEILLKWLSEHKISYLKNFELEKEYLINGITNSNSLIKKNKFKILNVEH